MRWRLYALVPLILLALAGCGDDDGGGSAPDGAGQRRNLAPGEALISYSIVGGSQNIDNELEVQPDGSYTVERGKEKLTGTISQARLASLEKLFTDAAFEDIQSDTTRLNDINGQPNYDIRYNGHPVTVIHGITNGKLIPIAAALDAFIASPPTD